MVASDSNILSLGRFANDRLRENKYPGCACDVPSHNYTWSFEPKQDWSAVYAGSGEIFDYFNTFAVHSLKWQYGMIEALTIKSTNTACINM